jgi:hypothetical protein
MNRRDASFAFSLVLFSTLTACSGGGESQSSAGADVGWTGHTDIQSTFADNCSRCHDSAWASCWSVQASASSVESVVSSGEMPLGGSLSATDKSAVLAWLDQGAPCSGTKPDDVQGGGGGGGADTPGAAVP